MKKEYFIGIVVILIIVGGFYLLMQKEISDEEILEIIQPDITKYCNQLEEQVTHSACPTCRISSYKKVDTFSKSLDVAEYIIDKKEDASVVEIRLPLIYGQNTRTGEIILTFEINYKGEVVNQNLTLAQCK